MSLLPNPYVALAGLALCVGAFFYGQHVGANGEIAKQAKLDAVVEKVSKAAMDAAADAIAGIKVINRTNETRLEREIVRVPDFSQCHAGADALRVLNDALAGAAPAAGTPGSGVVPEPDPAP